MARFRITPLQAASDFQALKTDPRIVPSIGRETNERVRTLNADEAAGTLSIERERRDANGIWMPVGYYFVQCIDGACDAENVTALKRRLADTYAGQIPGRFGVVRPILVASSFTPEALKLMPSVIPEEECYEPPELYESLG
jgi:hypothetical protein